MQKYGIRLCGPLFVSALLALPASAQEPPTIVISEIDFAGSSASTADEWLELANVGTSPVDVSNWVIGGAATGGEALAIAEGTIIAPHQTLVIANYGKGNAKTTLDVDPGLVTSAVALANSNLSLVLLKPDGSVVDQYVDDGTPDFGSTSPASSIERDLNDLSWHTATASVGLTDTNQLGTPGSAVFSSTPVSTTTSETAPVVETPTTPAVLVAPEAPSSTPIQCTVPTTPVVEEPSTSETPVTEPTTPVEPATTPAETPTPVPAPVPSPATTPAPTAFHDGDVVINEIYSDSGDGDEWVELLNTQSETITLTGWSLQDASGKVTPLSNILTANGLALVLNPAGKLNNGGDTVTLIDPAGNTIDSIVYGTDSVPLPTRDKSVARDSLNYWYLVSPTANTTNIFPDTTPETSPDTTPTYDDTQTNESDPVSDNSGTAEGTMEEPDVAPATTDTTSCTQHVIATASPLQAAAKVAQSTSATTKNGQTILEGVIVAAPKNFGSQTAFMNGHELYFYHADWPDLPVGSFVRISGVISQTDGHDRLKIASADDITVLGKKDADPLDLTPGLIDTLPHGTLVRVHGVVSARNGKKLTLIDDSGASVTIYANDNAHLSLGTLAGAELTITGVLRRTKDGADLMPRGPEDIVAENADGTVEQAALAAASTGGSTPWVGGGLLTGGVGALGTWFVRSRKMSLV